MTDAAQPAKRSAIDRFLNVVEVGGNALPHPATLFAILAVAIVVLSWVAAQFDLSVQHPTTGELITPVNLMSVEGLHRILTGLVTNFTGFAPLATSCLPAPPLSHSPASLSSWLSSTKSRSSSKSIVCMARMVRVARALAAQGRRPSLGYSPELHSAPGPRP